MRVAALDLGSNTSLLMIADVEEGRIKKILRDELRVTRMGQGVHQNRKLHPEALARLDDCFREYSAIVKSEKVDTVLAMATSAARDVTNADELFSLGRKHGFEIEIIPGDREAEITFKGSTFEEETTSGLYVVDVGGGSTEIIGSDDDGRLHGGSVDVGSVRLTEMFVSEHPIASVEIRKIKDYVRSKIKEKLATISLPRPVDLIAVAGTPTTLAAVIQKTPYSHEVVHGFEISLVILEEWMERLAKMTVKERQMLPGMDQKRADVLVAGLIVLIETCKYLNLDRVRVSDRGVRFGVALYAYERLQ